MIRTFTPRPWAATIAPERRSPGELRTQPPTRRLTPPSARRWLQSITRATTGPLAADGTPPRRADGPCVRRGAGPVGAVGPLRRPVLAVQSEGRTGDAGREARVRFRGRGVAGGRSLSS